MHNVSSFIISIKSNNREGIQPHKLQRPKLSTEKPIERYSSTHSTTSLNVLTTPESIIESTSTQDLLDDLISGEGLRKAGGGME